MYINKNDYVALDGLGKFKLKKLIKKLSPITLAKKYSPIVVAKKFSPINLIKPKPKAKPVPVAPELPVPEYVAPVEPIAPIIQPPLPPEYYPPAQYPPAQYPPQQFYPQPMPSPVPYSQEPEYIEDRQPLPEVQPKPGMANLILPAAIAALMFLS